MLRLSSETRNIKIELDKDNPTSVLHIRHIFKILAIDTKKIKRMASTCNSIKLNNDLIVMETKNNAFLIQLYR